VPRNCCGPAQPSLRRVGPCCDFEFSSLKWGGTDSVPSHFSFPCVEIETHGSGDISGHQLGGLQSSAAVVGIAKSSRDANAVQLSPGGQNPIALR
jgi:hypothetical protein